MERRYNVAGRSAAIVRFYGGIVIPTVIRRQLTTLLRHRKLCHLDVVGTSWSIVNATSCDVVSTTRNTSYWRPISDVAITLLAYAIVRFSGVIPTLIRRRTTLRRHRKLYRLDVTPVVYVLVPVLHQILWYFFAICDMCAQVAILILGHKHVMLSWRGTPNS